jgi:purine-binding chemotaxis protein CheW
MPPPAEAPADAFEILAFDLGTERYAFPSDQVREIRALAGLTPLPATPAFLAGLINVRGRIVPVLDLRPLFGLPLGSAAPTTVLLLSSGLGDVGVLTMDRPAVTRVRETELGPLPSWAPSGLDGNHVRGVSEDFVVVLDAERLLGDSRLLVTDDT